MTDRALGFSFVRTADDKVLISRHGRHVRILAGARAVRLLARVEGATEAQAQLEMARATGTYRRGNENRATR